MKNGLVKRLVRDDRGFSLAELIFASAFSIVIMLIVGGILVGAMNANKQVGSLTHAASTGQLIARSVESGVRNAAGPLGSTDPDQAAGMKAETVTANGQLFRARVAIGAAAGTVVWQCQAWFYSSTTGGVYWATSNAGAIADPVSFTVINGAGVAQVAGTNWKLLGDGVSMPTGVSAFFGAANKKVVLRFNVASENVSLVLIPSTVVQRTLHIAGTGPTACF